MKPLAQPKEDSPEAIKQQARANAANFSDDKIQEMYNRFQAKQKGSTTQRDPAAKGGYARTK